VTKRAQRRVFSLANWEYLVRAATCASTCGIIAAGHLWNAKHQAKGRQVAEKLRAVGAEASLKDAMAFTISVAIGNAAKMTRAR
jgi:hypothetical protein